MKISRENKKYMLLILPLIGVITGSIMYAFCMICMKFGFGQSFFALVGAVIPILITGGVNLAGFMKTTDALRNARSVEKRLEMMEDVNAGIYAVIAAAAYYMLYAGGLVMIWKDKQLLLLGIGYVISGTLGGLAVVWFPEIKSKESSNTLASKSEKQVFRIFLSLILVLCFGTCIMFSTIMGLLEALLCMWIWTFYYYMSKKCFGGIAAELTGFFIALCDLSVVLFVGVFGRILM
ncbi:MAG: adenosylcobinamide-GDP ribazoletransferase [Lachnospiraceae bacterium]|nr:adenosylcobinamide-GDP ribazoletransferase [Lachnospiraceae bacterium]